MFELLLRTLFKYEHIDYGYSDQWLLCNVTMIVPNQNVGSWGTLEKIKYVKIAEDRPNKLAVYLYNNVENFMDCYNSETEYDCKFIFEVLLSVTDT